MKTVRLICDILLYIIVFALLQLIAGVGLNLVVSKPGLAVALANIASGILTFALFVLLQWSPWQNFAKRPLAECVLVGMLALTLLLPSVWLQEILKIETNDEIMRLLEDLIREPIGFVAVGIIAPIVEEMVFRGAILRRCLVFFCADDHREARPWLAIVISALAFALVHGNLSQGIHAFLMGLILGWLYLRTRSILPGIIFHWVNNSVVFLQCHLTDLPADATLTDMFGGQRAAMYIALAVSATLGIVLFLKIKQRLDSLSS